jgi:hypothetical protein
MNANRKADLQRKLSLVPVPKPPVGLAERIKGEIPKQLGFDAEKERQRFRRSVAFDMRVAASVLLVISCAYLALQLLTRVEQPHMEHRLQPVPAKAGAPLAQVGEEPLSPPVPKRERQPKLAARRAKPQVLVADAKEKAPATPPPPPAAAAESMSRAPMAKVTALSGVAMRDQASPAASLDRFARADAAPASGVAFEQEMTISPISGRQMLRVSLDRGGDISDVNVDVAGARRIAAGSRTSVYEMQTPKATINVRYRHNGVSRSIERTAEDAVPWTAASRRTKAAILTAEWAQGSDPQRVARAAREAGLDELADAVEKP